MFTQTHLKHVISFCCLFFSISLTAQKGMISGKIYDKETGETIIGAIIELNKDGIQITGAATDIDGNYLLEAEPGVYEISIDFLSFARYTVSDITVRPREVFTLDVALEPESVSLGEIVVKADAVRTTEVSLIALQRKAISIQDGISSQQISRTGGTNAADAIRQMPAALIQDGRYIVMRGLGDRYSISQLNGVTLPGTDPYRNSSSLDLIPTQIIDNIISIKTFTPDLPGNFSGGLVNISTKSIPDKFTLTFLASASYNSNSNLRDNFDQHPDAGKYDWLGLDDGSRNQPAFLLDPAVREQLSSSTYLTARQPGNDDTREIFHQSSRALSNSFFPVTSKSPLNSGFNVSVGHRFPLFKKDLGFTFSINYAANFHQEENAAISTFINTNTDFLFPYQDLTERRSVFNPALGGMATMAYKLSANHLLSANVIFNNDAEFISRNQSGSFLGQVSNSLAEFNTSSLEFIQRQLANYQLSGRHVFPALGKAELSWDAAATTSFQHEPDLRYFAYTKVCDDPDGGEDLCEYYINNAEYAFPYHFFRKLSDDAYQGKLDITIPLSNAKSSGANSMKFGSLYSTVKRNFEEYRYQLNNSGIPSDLQFSNFGGDFTTFLNEENFGIIDTLFKENGDVQRYVTGYHYINQINARNFYTGNSNVIAGYLMANYEILKSLRAVGGIRLEQTDMEVISMDPTVPAGQIDQLDYLYSINLIYALSEKSNIRIAASQTLARPNLRELAPFVQFDTKNGFFNVGNPSLQRTLIRNYDARYEIYPAQSGLIAVSAYYKEFDNPIIRAFNPKATIPELSFINVDKAVVIGAELELRKELVLISPILKNVFFNANLALIYSRYTIPADEIANSKNIDPEYDEKYRPFQGQAPFIINAILSYVNPESGIEAALSYNVSGKKLHNISLFATPDIYEESFSLLNFKLAKRFAKYYQVSLTARNLLNNIQLKTHEFNGQQYIAESSIPGRSFGVSIAYQIR